MYEFQRKPDMDISRIGYNINNTFPKENSMTNQPETTELPVEEFEGTALETIPQEYDDLNRADDQAIVDMMTGHAIQDYVYSFKRGGRSVEGLTLTGINEAANRRGGIQIEEVEYSERENSWIAIAKAVDTITGSSRYGAFEQPKMSGSKPDPFAFTKAIHKAQRNAIKQLLPVTLIKEVLNFYLNRQKGSGSEQPHVDDSTTKAKKATFAVVNELLAPLSEEGITNADLWNYMKRKCGVETQNEVTIVQWSKLTAELKAAKDNADKMEELCTSIKQLKAASETAEADETTESTEQQEPETESNGDDNTEEGTTDEK